MRPKKSLGQNFLNNESILTKIVNSGNIEINDWLGKKVPNFV